MLGCDKVLGYVTSVDLRSQAVHNVTAWQALHTLWQVTVHPEAEPPLMVSRSDFMSHIGHALPFSGIQDLLFVDYDALVSYLQS